MKLHQTIALVAGKKARAQKLLTEAHHGWNTAAISGMTRTYAPKDEEGDKLPPESKLVHLRVTDRIAEVIAKLIEYYDIVVTQETGNTAAKGPLIIDGETVMMLPVTAILFLERQLVDLHAFVKQLPTLPADREWHWDDNKNCYATAPVQTVKTNKVPDALVLYPATKEHPAQTQAFNRDVAVGEYTTVHLSSAVPEADKAAMLTRVEKLQDDAKVAREIANSDDAEEQTVGKVILDYVFNTKSAV